MSHQFDVEDGSSLSSQSSYEVPSKFRLDVVYANFHDKKKLS